MKLIAKQLVEDLKFNIINKDKSNIDRQINGVSINRAGLELAGELTSDYYKKTIVGWGTKEFIYFQKLKKEDSLKAYNRVLSEKTPLILLSKQFHEDNEVTQDILSVANAFKIPVILLGTSVGKIMSDLTTYLIEQQAEIVSLHASFVVIHGQGVVIKGPSGIGKSEAVLELVHNGYTFVSDDSVEVYKIGTVLYGKPAELTKDLLEARGIGIIDIPHVYGTRVIANKSKVDLFVELVPRENLNEVDRLGTANLFEDILETKVPKIQIPIGSGRSIAVLVEAATNVFLDKKAGISPVSIIEKRRRERDGTN